MKIVLISYTKGINNESPEKLIEKAARVSYESYNKVTEDSHKRLIESLIRLGHLSPIEFADATFEISDVSRALLAQITRHRLVSFMVRSQRYVNETSFKYVTPQTIQQDEKASINYDFVMKTISGLYNQLIESGIPKEDARFLLPNATTTHLFMKANFREWMHIISLRTSLHAQWEIRELLTLVWRDLYRIAPTVFGKVFVEKFDCDKELFENRIVQ